MSLQDSFQDPKCTIQTTANEKESIELQTSDPRPSVSARIQLRRSRIERRNLLVKRKRDASEIQSDKERKTLLEKQLAESSSLLSQLIEDGSELINNVRVGNDVRESRRIGEHSEAERERMETLKEEAKLAEQKFLEINLKWKVIESYNDPLDIHNDSKIQREKCEELISQKNAIVQMLKKELEYEDFRFTSDQEVQLNDISILVERIDNQINIMRRAYRNQLKLIENTIDIERMDLLKSNRNKWEVLNSENEREDVRYIEKRHQKIEEHETNMMITVIEYEEKCRQLKKNLENDVQMMQTKLEELKTKCLLNSEKLSYDYHILRKRDEESISLKSQQRRKINRLQEEISSLRQTLKDLTATTQEEISKINGELITLQFNAENICRKINHFSQMNNKTYFDLWKFNVKETEKLIDEILVIDRLIHEQQLSLAWSSPKTRMDLEDVFQSSNKLTLEHEGSELESTSLNSGVKAKADRKKIAKLILQKICDETDFLLDKHVENLLMPYSTDKKNLIKLDNIFMVLGVKSKEDIKLLKTHFMPFAVCLSCSDKFSSEKFSERKDGTFLRRSLSAPDLQRESLKQVPVYSKRGASSSDLISYGEKRNHYFPKRESRVSCCLDSHSFSLESTDILKALNNFVVNFHKEKALSNHNAGAQILDDDHLNTIGPLMSQNAAEKYWGKFHEIISSDQEKLWDALTAGLNKYYIILKERQKLKQDVESLNKENDELKRLLERYLSPPKEKNNQSKSCFPPLNVMKPNDMQRHNQIVFQQTVSQMAIQVKQS